MSANGKKKNNRNTFAIQFNKLESRFNFFLCVFAISAPFRFAKVAIACFLLFVFISASGQINLIKKTKYFDDKNLVVKEIFFIEAKNENVKSGAYTAYYSSGKIKTKGNFKEDLSTGFWERYLENGELKSIYNYEKGKLKGQATVFFENGNRSQLGYFKENLEDSLWKFYYESGKIKSKGFYKNGLQDGFWEYFHEDSTLKATADVNKGKGIYKEYFSTGAVRMEGLIVNGLSDSVWRYFYENSILKATGFEKSGERQGFWKFYHSDGTISSEGHFSKNLKEGNWKYFHENGKLSAEGSLESDDKEGVWKFFMPSGALMGEGNFTKGNGDYQEYYDNGKVKLKGKIVNNQYEGTWTFFFEDGGLEGECTYTKGYGQYLGYYENGTIKMKGKMHNGQKIGFWDLLGKEGKLIGHYKTFYDMVQLNQVVKPKPKSDSVVLKPRNYSGPDFMFSNRKIRHYIPKINELRGFIVACNPFAAALNSFPIGIEFFFQDRLGFELMFTYYRQPFFANHGEELENKRVYTLGNSIDFRQKLYSADHGSGNLYIGQELRLTNFSHKLLVIETTDSVTTARSFEGKETKIELSILVGNRFFQYYHKHKCFTLDLYTGIGFGYRFTKYPEQLLIYNRLKTNTLTIPFRLGFNFGFLF